MNCGPPLLTLFAYITIPALLCGCALTRPIKGGRAVTTPRPTGGLEQTIIQPDNPAQVSRQEQETIKVRTYTLPAGSRLEFAPDALTLPRPDALHALHAPPAPTLPRSHAPPAPTLLTLPHPMPVTEREETRAKAELGAAQKDTARELGAKLASLRSLTWVGLILFVAGLVSLFWPPLRAIVGSVTTSAAVTLGGLALMILPTLVVGHELLILGGVGLAVGGWFLRHGHGQRREW